jgi:hypothetical protein
MAVADGLAAIATGFTSSRMPFKIPRHHADSFVTPFKPAQ